MGLSINSFLRTPIIESLKVFLNRKTGGLNESLSTSLYLDLTNLKGWQGDKCIFVSIAPYRPLMTFSIIDCELAVDSDDTITIFFKFWDNSLSRYLICSSVYSEISCNSHMNGKRHYPTSRAEIERLWAETLASSNTKTQNCMSLISKPTYWHYLIYG